MSIILKGIDMPKDAEYFSVTFYKKGAYRKEKIMDISEAIQIPKNHGRLIDGDVERSIGRIPLGIIRSGGVRR